MSRLTDSTSDSDSNSLTSWIFVDENNADNEEANKYYLNCSSEPVQELTEKCLNSAGSEIETDSDGFSVISESDSDKRKLQNDDTGNTSEEIEKESGNEVIKTVCLSVVKSERIDRRMAGDDRNTLIWYIIFTIVLLLALIAPLLLSNDELFVNNSLNDCESTIEIKFYEYNSDFASDTMVLNDIPTDFSFELIPEHSETFDDVETNEEGKEFVHSSGEKGNKKMYSNKKIKFKVVKNERMRKRCDDSKDNNREKDGYKGQIYYDKKMKKRRNQLGELEKSLRKKERELNKMKRQLKNLKSKISKELNFLHALKKGEYKKNVHFNKSKRFNSSLTGDWYYNLYNERNKIREEEQMANWVFDRAEMRNRKRDKAIWYFNWMTDREHLRVKKDFKQFSY